VPGAAVIGPEAITVSAALPDLQICMGQFDAARLRRAHRPSERRTDQVLATCASSA
jgi:hypothetical protein